MTSPTGPDRDRLRASDAGQETPPPVPYDQHEREMLELIGQRDRLEDIADRLAAAIAPAEVLGEHSSDNNPWRNALDYADTATQRRDAAPQQPPAQERETFPVHQWVGDGDQEQCTVCGTHAPADDVECFGPPSEADSAGEDGFSTLLVPVEGHALVCTTCASLVLDNPNALSAHRRHHLAASSGVRGGDDQARERLADVLAVCDELDQIGVDILAARIRRAAGGGR